MKGSHSCRSDNISYRFPVSVKGIIRIADKILLLKNERDEWELPGGKLEIDETPPKCVEREIFEEVHLKVSADGIIDAWVYTIREDIRVLIVTYHCHVLSGDIAISHEHKEYGWYPLADIQNLNMPEGYKQSILSTTTG